MMMMMRVGWSLSHSFDCPNVNPYPIFFCSLCLGFLFVSSFFLFLFHRFASMILAPSSPLSALIKLSSSFVFLTSVFLAIILCLILARRLNG